MINGSQVIGTFLLATSLTCSTLTQVYTNTAVSTYRSISESRSTGTPKLVEVHPKGWVSEAQDLFTEARDFTEEESYRYEVALSTLYESTGENFFDL